MRAGEPVSPELALVDPELAERARRELPLPTAPSPRRTPRPSEPAPPDVEEPRVEPELERPSAAYEEAEPRRQTPRPSEPAPPDVEEPHFDEPERPPHAYVEPEPRRRGRFILRVVAIPLLGAILLGAGFFVAQRYASLGSSAPSGATVRASSRVGALPTAPASSRVEALPTAPARTSRPATRSRRTVVTPPRQAAPSPRQAAPSPRGARTFAWVAVPDVEFYEVSILRAGREVFTTRTVRPRLRLPREWTYRGQTVSLSAGHYRWVVRPAFGSRAHPRYGQPVVAADLVVPK